MVWAVCPKLVSRENIAEKKRDGEQLIFSCKPWFPFYKQLFTANGVLWGQIDNANTIGKKRSFRLAKSQRHSRIHFFRGIFILRNHWWYRYRGGDWEGGWTRPNVFDIDVSQGQRRSTRLEKTAKSLLCVFISNGFNREVPFGFQIERWRWVRTWRSFIWPSTTYRLALNIGNKWVRNPSDRKMSFSFSSYIFFFILLYMECEEA